MTNKEAIEILTEELHHTEQHLTAKDKAPDYYEELGNYCESVRMAINALTVEARPKGEWVQTQWFNGGSGVYLCTNCNSLTYANNIKPFKFCNYCGAEMTIREGEK